MEPNWATEHLHVIRTLMERAALYRRALAPVMILNGALGALAALAGIPVGITTPRLFIGYWMGVAVVAVVGSFLLVRRQALKDHEQFWSPPTRRVAQALLPPLFVGFALGAALLLPRNALGVGHLLPGTAREVVAGSDPLLWLPLIWAALYGCAVHAAGFFMPRGMKLFGWALVLASSALCALGLAQRLSEPAFAHAFMGLFFGATHLAYGIYLYFTEPRRQEP